MTLRTFKHRNEFVYTFPYSKGLHNKHGLYTFKHKFVLTPCTFKQKFVPTLCTFKHFLVFFGDISVNVFVAIYLSKYTCDQLLWYYDKNILVTNCCDIVTKYWCYQTLGAVAFCQDWVKTSGEGFMPMIIWYSLTANILPSVSFYKNHRTNS